MFVNLYFIRQCLFMFVFGAAGKPARSTLAERRNIIVLYLNMHKIDDSAKSPADTDGREHFLYVPFPLSGNTQLTALT